MSVYASMPFAWLGAAIAMYGALQTEAIEARIWLMVALTAVVMTTLGALLVVMLPPITQVYRAGYEAGQSTTGCTAFKPDVRLISGGGVSVVGDVHTTGRRGVVVQLRTDN